MFPHCRVEETRPDNSGCFGLRCEEKTGLCYDREVSLT